MKKLMLLALAALLVAGGGILLVVAFQRLRPSAGLEMGTTPVTRQQATSAAGAYEPLRQFTLTERSGRAFGSADLKGKPHVVNFFFASCPSTCRAQSAKVAELAREFGPQGVTFVSVTVDPEIDTPDVLARYADLFNADREQWVFLTGDMLLIRRIGGEMYQVPVDNQTHTERLIVIDRAGEVRGKFHWNKPEEIQEMRVQLRDLSAEQGDASADAPADASASGEDSAADAGLPPAEEGAEHAPAETAPASK